MIMGRRSGYLAFGIGGALLTQVAPLLLFLLAGDNSWPRGTQASWSWKSEEKKESAPAPAPPPPAAKDGAESAPAAKKADTAPSSETGGAWGAPQVSLAALGATVVAALTAAFG